MASLFKLFAFVALGSSGVLATPTAARLGGLLAEVSLDIPPLHPYPTDVPPTYPTYPTECTTPPPVETTVTVTKTETTTIPTTTTVTATATVTAPCTPSLTCDKYGYLVQNTTLYRVDLAKGTFTTIATRVGDNTPINAIAYNTLDNYLYARQEGKNALIRIGSDGRTENVGTFPSGISGVNVGDIDGEGYYWYGGSGRTWNQMDLRPGSSTLGTTLASGTADVLGLSIADWAYLPDGGAYLYSVGANSAGGSTLVRFSLDSKKWEVIQRYPRIGGTNAAWGAVYGINNGTLYASNNRDGQIWAFPIKGGAATLTSQGPKSGLNDGARCALNLNI